MKWTVHIPGLFGEIIGNSQTSRLARPLQLTSNLLGQVAQRAAQLNDPILNALMMDLTLYEIADPDSPEYDPAAVILARREAEKTARATR
jgi:hypothetical protein